MQAGGAIALAAHITSFSQLTLLDVGHNRMQNLGAEHLAHALAHLCIRHLDFGDNGCSCCSRAAVYTCLLAPTPAAAVPAVPAMPTQH